MRSSFGNPGGQPPLLAALLGMAVFAVTVGGTYIYDDLQIAKEDKRLSAPGFWGGGLWGLYWTKDYNYDVEAQDGSIDNLYRPLVSMTYAVQVWLEGERPGPMHGVNVLLYGACCALVARLGRLAGGSRGVGVGWVSGVLFAVHPVHSEAVCAIVGRAELMAMLGIVGAIVLHLGGPQCWRRTVGILVCMVVALLSKEQGMLVAGVLLAAEPLRRWRLKNASALDVASAGQVAVVTGTASARTVSLGSGSGAPMSLGPMSPAAELESAPPVELGYAMPGSKPRASMTPLQGLVIGVCFLTGGYIVLREQILHLKFWWDRSFLDPAVQPMIWSHGMDRWLMPLVLLGHYVAQLVAPVSLSFDYSGRAIGWVVSKSDPYLYLGAASAVAGVAGLLVAVWKRAWGFVLVLAAFALTYGVIGNIVSLIGVNYGERLIFTPSVFFVVLAALAIVRLPLKVAGGLVAVVALVFGIHTAVYASRWSDRVSFYEYSLREQPRAIRLHQLVAMEMTTAKRLDRAAEVAAAGRAVMPEYWDIWIQSSVIAEQQGKWEDAERFMAKAADIDPRHAATRLGLLRARRAAAGK